MKKLLLVTLILLLFSCEVKIEYTPNPLYKRTEEKQEWEYKECKHILYNRYCIDCREYEWNKRLNK
jgi:hypothetical protein